MYEDPKSKISQLEKVLDAREDLVSGKVKRHVLHNQDNNIRQDWDDSELKVGTEVFTVPDKEKGFSLSLKILIASVIFFIVASGIAFLKFFIGGNVVSGDNIEVIVKAPISVSAGQVLPIEIEIINNNNVTLSGVDMGVTFPVGATEVNDASVPVKRLQEYIGDITPGQSVRKNMKVVLFGIENEKKEIKIVLEYKVTGSNSLFNKTKLVPVLISSAPVSMVIKGPSEVNTNQNVDFTVEITSNSPTVIKNSLLKIEYPFGFQFNNSVPKTLSKNNIWLIGDLEPGAKRTIKFSGVLNGQEGEERGFNFSFGSQSKSDNLSIDTLFSSSFSSITIRRPFVSADIFLDDVDATEYVSKAGSKIEGVIKWQNNLPYEVSDVSILVRINGNAVDKSAIEAEGGYYKSIDNTIIFNKTTNRDLALLDPGKTGESKFSLGSFSAGSVTGSTLTNPTIVLNVSVSGKRMDYASDKEDVLFSDSRKIKLTSDPQLFAKALYYIGPFQNTGPIPPKAERETTYTVTWTVTNQLNNLSNGLVSATLPPYIKWLSVISPEREKMSYDESTGLLTWSVGNVLAGAGTISSAREVSFQISLLPSVNQIGSTPDLISEAVLSAKDNFTSSSVSDSFSALNIRLANDPYFKAETDTVTK